LPFSKHDGEQNPAPGTVVSASVKDPTGMQATKKSNKPTIRL